VFPFHRPRSTLADRLSWDSSGHLALFPFIDLIPGVRLPTVLPPLWIRAANSNRVPTSSFCTTAPVFSTDSSGFSPDFSPPFRVVKDLRACCIPLPIMGFDAFLSLVPVAPTPRAAPLLAPFAVGHTDCDSSHRSSYPPEDSPHLQPWRVTALVASSDFSYTVDPRPSRRFRFQFRRSCRIDGTRSLEALLCGWVRTIAHRIRAYVGLPSLGLVPLRGCLHVGSCVPTGLR